ncbi:sugar ABC transporter permease [Phototrophicus methaneseepsis]|uniref:Sugar ABC transporter permease n=1 Tax=Phototrophicus methaneseepsis TaxID=2710758 RepID=A0A7S8E5M1_9CHLR|nr:sugar ABC transporter permease [Phototrophicus methaneseepsis]QPC80822.1 sugar ABC transporter permease [Phototrophicus methaneseepsis]
MASATTISPTGQATRRKRFSKYGSAPYIFISPFFLLFGIFFLFPSVAALALSLFRWNGIGEVEWMGIANYQRIFSDGIFWQAAQNTLIYTAASVFIMMPIALILATLLNSKSLRFANIWRAMYFTPVVTSTVATSLVFQILLNENSGLLNVPLIGLGLEPIDWLGDRAWVKVALIIVIGWRSIGLITIYFLAGLQSIPYELYEAAEIDGAGTIQQFFHVTIPMLRPIILFVSIIVMLNAIQIFDEPRILTEGGPANASLSIVQYLYERGFERLRFGFASSVGTVLFFVVFVLSFIQLRFFGAFRDEGDS